MWNSKLNNHALLSTLWIFVVVNFFARDIHELGRPGMLEQVMSGVIDGVVITEELMLVGGIMFEIPILMILLSVVLGRAINRCVTIVAALMTLAIIAVNNMQPDLDNIFFMVIQIAALIAIIRIAWVWKEEG